MTERTAISESISDANLPAIDIYNTMIRVDPGFYVLMPVAVRDETIEKLEALVRALEEIVNPVQAMQNRADAEGMQLDGHVAVNLANDPHYLRELARKALSRPVGTVNQTGGSK